MTLEFTAGGRTATDRERQRSVKRRVAPAILCQRNVTFHAAPKRWEIPSRLARHADEKGAESLSHTADNAGGAGPRRRGRVFHSRMERDPRSGRCPTCVSSTPSVTEGPYWVDEKLFRSDIRTDPSTGVARAGIPLSLTINVQNIGASGC